MGGYANYTLRLLELEENFRKEGLDFVYFPVSHPNFASRFLIGDIYRLIRDCLLFVFSAVRYRMGRGDIVHIHGLYDRSILRETFFVAIAKTLGCKIFYEARAGHFLKFISSQNIYARLGRFVMRFCDLVSVQGSRNIEQFTPILGRQPKVHQNYISQSFLDKIAMVRSENISRNVNKAVFVGYVSYTKNCHIFRELASQLPDFEFVLIGAVEETLALELDMPNIRLLGLCQKGRIVEELLSAQYFIFPSTHFGEGQPNAVLEALVCGCIPIAFDFGYINDLVHPPFLISVEKGRAGIVRLIKQLGASPGADDASPSLSQCDIMPERQFDRLVELYDEIAR